METGSSGTAGFCTACGSILPILKSSGDLSCFKCKKSFGAEQLDTSEIHYTVHFNTLDRIDEAEVRRKKDKKGAAEADGPIVERKCPKCGNDVMSYATLQLRSADEGQTVFYTCTKCKYKESENS